jgi:hypothetical protein
MKAVARYAANAGPKDGHGGRETKEIVSLRHKLRSATAGLNFYDSEAHAVEF